MKLAPDNTKLAICAAFLACVMTACDSPNTAPQESAAEEVAEVGANQTETTPSMEVEEVATIETAETSQPVIAETSVVAAAPVETPVATGQQVPSESSDLQPTPAMEQYVPPAAPVPSEVAQTNIDSQPAGNELLTLAEAGDADAQYQLGVANEANPEESSKWYLRAAEQGNVDAQMTMAVRYTLGQGVERNLEEAERWLALAESQEQQENVTIVHSTRQVRVQPRPTMNPVNPVNPFNPMDPAFGNASLQNSNLPPGFAHLPLGPTNVIIMLPGYRPIRPAVPTPIRSGAPIGVEIGMAVEPISAPQTPAPTVAPPPQVKLPPSGAVLQGAPHGDLRGDSFH